jgi:hypothetical protein
MKHVLVAEFKGLDSQPLSKVIELPYLGNDIGCIWYLPGTDR